VEFGGNLRHIRHSGPGDSGCQTRGRKLLV